MPILDLTWAKGDLERMQVRRNLYRDRYRPVSNGWSIPDFDPCHSWVSSESELTLRLSEIVGVPIERFWDITLDGPYRDWFRFDAAGPDFAVEFTNQRYTYEELIQASRGLYVRIPKMQHAMEIVDLYPETWFVTNLQDGMYRIKATDVAVLLASINKGGIYRRACRGNGGIIDNWVIPPVSIGGRPVIECLQRYLAPRLIEANQQRAGQVI